MELLKKKRVAFKIKLIYNKRQTMIQIQRIQFIGKTFVDIDKDTALHFTFKV